MANRIEKVFLIAFPLLRELTGTAFDTCAEDQAAF
jgi:hypothetical protein